MIELVLAHADLARVRFAHSPIHELAASLLVLQDPSRWPMYDSWLSSVRPRRGDLRLELLTALAPTGRYLPGFLFPVPGVPRPGFADELEVVVASPRRWSGPSSTRSATVDRCHPNSGLSMRTRPFICLPSPKRCSGTGRSRSCRSGRGCGRLHPRPDVPHGAVRRRRSGLRPGRPASRAGHGR